MRSLLRSVVSADARLEVAGTAADGASALSSIEHDRPDLILLDVEMPVMDGLVTLRELHKRGNKMPVIMCSSLTQRGARVTIEALAGGASDYVAKPTGQSGREAAVQALTQELIPKIHALTRRPTSAGPGAAPARSQAVPPLIPGLSRAAGLPAGVAFPARPQPITAEPTVLAIGVSTGGPAALDVLLPRLPAGFPLPVLVVQHMPEVFTKILAERLNGRCQIPVREAADGEPVRPGAVLIARGNWHMEVLAGAQPAAAPTIRLNQGPQENHCRPSVDVLFRAAAGVYGSGVLAVVLTGMGSDGLSGCRLIREQGGTVLAQDEASSTVWGMPGAVASAGLAHRIVPLEAMAQEILRLTAKAGSAARAGFEFHRQAVS
jgi:two-component system chemotaxis response regulator CheB